MADWFYGKNNTQHGPVSEQEIQTLLSSGQIDTSTIIWREGMTDWLPMKDVPEFQSLQTTAASPYSTPQTSAQPAAGAVAYTSAIPTDGLSIACLICGILGIVTCYLWGLFGIPAVICGHISIKKINNSLTPIQGKGMAIAGLVMGYIGIGLQLLVIVFFIAIAGSSI